MDTLTVIETLPGHATLPDFRPVSSFAREVRPMNPGMPRGHALLKDDSVLKHKLALGLVRRTLQFGRPYARTLVFFLVLVVLDAAVGVINPLIYRKAKRGHVSLFTSTAR